MLNRTTKFFLLVTVFSTFYPLKSLAQIVPDATLGTESSTIRSIDQLRDAIKGGAVRGKNLFHSFTEFNISEGKTVNFINPEGIANIFSRVTGNNASKIFGTLGVDGTANLFLINPNGIIFGKNAAVNINGSFLATTAENIEFSDGSNFSSAKPNKPLLTIDFPVGLGMGSNPGNINIQGEQNNVFLEIPSFKVVAENLPPSIKVKPKQNISLIGGNISFNGGGLQAPGGDIQLASIGNNQTLKLLLNGDWFVADLTSAFNFKNINLSNAAYVDVSYKQAGNINISGKNVSINEGSVVLANTAQATNNAININASELLEIKGSSGKNQIDVFLDKQGNIPAYAFKNTSNYYSISIVGADILSDLNGSGNNININAKNLQILDAGQIRTVNFSNFENNNAGNINIKAENILVEGTNNIDGFIGSVINSTTGINTKGSSGDVNIIASILEVQNGGRIKADTFSFGAGGQLSIAAEQIFLRSPKNYSNVRPLFQTGLSTSPGDKDGSAGTIDIKTNTLFISGAEINNSSFSKGNPGEIIINTEQLKILDGGAIRAETASGSSADIFINAKDIELNGTKRKFSDFIGGISTSTRSRASGNGGNINIKTSSLKIFNGAIIRTISLGAGDAGNININAETVEVSGFDRLAEDPIASERVSKINTGSLKSNGGNLNINSNSISIDNFGIVRASTEQGVKGGNIIIDSNKLELSNQSQITATAGGTGNGGNITINADNIVGFNNSDITANAFQGNGGNIEINSDVILGIESRAKLTPLSDITASSDLGIDGTVTINSPDTNADNEVLFSAKSPEPDRVKKLFNSSCLNPNRSRLARVILRGRGLPETPYNYFDRPTEEIEPPVEAIKKPQVQPEPQAQKSTPSDLIEPNAIEVDDDGRRFLVALTSEQIQSARVCQQQLDAIKKNR